MSPPASDGDPFALFGLLRRFRLDESRLRAAYLRLLAAAHPDRAGGAAAATIEAARTSAAINDAFRSVATPIERAETILRLEAVAPASNETLAPAFLMEMMELREALDDAIAAADSARVTAIQRNAEASRDALIATLGENLDRALDETPGLKPALLAEARRTLNELRYVQRVLERVASDRYSQGD